MGRKPNTVKQIDIIVEKVIREDYINSSFIQRKLQISYLGAQDILKKLAEMGYIEKFEPFKKLKVIKKHFIQ